MFTRLRMAWWLLWKGGGEMDAVYAMLVAKGLKTIDDVIPVFKESTLAVLEAMGLDGYGQPLK